MLHAEHLVLMHPKTGKTLDLTAPPPADFRKMLAELRKL
jgi:23S rRNA pseudouridine1911/1915/1917 synthase